MQESNHPFITPSSTSLSEDLLFFDTFSHSNSDKDNFDLVQFPSPVIIDQIKVVPLGQPVEANIPGSVRLGATNPSKCELEFFINDLTKQDAHTMTDLGKFYCSEKDTDFAPPLQIQTDGLLLRGSYRTLTLAIFGQVVPFDEKPDDEQIIMSAASPPAQTPASPIASERDLPYIVRSVNHELMHRLRDDEESIEDLPNRSDLFSQDHQPLDNFDDPNGDDMSESRAIDISKNRSTTDELSNSGDVPTQENFDDRDKKSTDDQDYSNDSHIDNNVKHPNPEETNSKKPPIEYNDTSEKYKPQTDDTLVDYDAQEWYFNVENYHPKPFTYFPDASLTLQERTLFANRSNSAQSNYGDTVRKEIEKVKEMFDVLGCSNQSKTEDWVTLVEDLTNDIANMSLCRTVSNEEMLEFLAEQVTFGLDMTQALGQKQTGYKVRHLKAGLKLATILFHCGQSAVKVLLKANISQMVLLLYNQDQMSLPLRHLKICSLSAACDSVEGVEHVITHRYAWKDAHIIAENIKSRIESRRSSTENDQSSLNSNLLDMAHQPLTCYQYMILLLLTQPVTRITIAIGNLMKKIKLYKNLSQLRILSQVKNELSDLEDSVFEQDHNDILDPKSRLEEGLRLVQDVVMLTKDGCSNIAQPVRYLPAKVQFHTKPTSNDSYLALYKWIKHFKIIESLDFLLTCSSTDILEVEQSIKLRAVCLAFIQLILDSPKGTQMLLSSDCYEQTTNLIKNLAQRIEPFRKKNHLGLDNLADASLIREESLSIATCRDMSMKLSYSFKVLSCIDKLFEFHRELLDNQSNVSGRVCDPEKVIHQMFIMSEHPYGLTAIMKHLSCIGNLDCILRFLDMPDSQKHLEFVKETSMDYVLELVATFFRLNNNVLEMAEEYLDTLTGLVCKIKDKTLSTRIKSLLPWLTPFETNQPFPLITYSEETFRQLTRVIRKSIPDCSIPFAQGLDYELPPQLITAVRILRQLCISPQVESFIESNFDIFSSQRVFLASEAKSSTSLPFVDSQPHQQNPNQSWNLNFHSGQSFSTPNNNFEDSLMDRLGQLNNLSKLYQPFDESICGDLKYHYGIMQLYEQEGLKRLLNTLRELTGNYPRPVYQSAALCGLRGRIVISYIHSVIMLLHSITCHLIDARGKEFKDTSIISVVLETYSLLCFVPKPENDKLSELSKREELSALQKSITLKYDNYQLAQQSKKLILSILISFSQICLSVSDSEENVISKSMWTKMLKEVVDFTLSAPVFFHHGLDVLTRILPAPLPSASILDTLDQEQLFKNINHRKLWSAHLHPLHHRLEMMIANLSLCNQSNIRTLLYYLCNQLCDLSSNAACMVTKTITDTFIFCAAKLTVDSSDSTGSNETGGNQINSRHSEERSSCHFTISGPNEARFATRMLLDLIANLITNQAFEIAMTNHLQVICKKDEKLIPSLYAIVKSQLDIKPPDGGLSETVDHFLSKTNSVANLIDAIRAIADATNTRDNFAPTNQATIIAPPEEMTKINLIEMARKASDGFNLATGITKTYRLKVLLDMNSRAHRPTESSSSSKRFERSKSGNHKELLVQSNSKPFVAPLRGRSRASGRANSFRSRGQNTSRPPSIHVDDFNDLYGDTSAQNTNLPPGATGRGYSGPSGRKDDYRVSPASRYQDLGRMSSPNSGSSHSGRHGYFNPQQPQPSPLSAGHPSNQSTAYGNRPANARSKYMKMK